MVVAGVVVSELYTIYCGIEVVLLSCRDGVVEVEGGTVVMIDSESFSVPKINLILF